MIPSIRLKDLPIAELHETLEPHGISLPFARQLQAAAVREDRWLPDGPGRSPSLLRRIREIAEIPRLHILDKVVSPTDGFARYVFRGDGPEPFEAVRIPLTRRSGEPQYVVCVSSQVGCAMGCAFCATAAMGFKRHLSTWEIVDQVTRISLDSQQPQRKTPPIQGVVFMGMGEPLLNFDEVMRAFQILWEPCGMAVSPKAMSLSTVGIIPGLRRLMNEPVRPKLIVSLTSADPAQRRELLPAEATWSTTELFETLREYHRQSGERITLAWTMISGVNTRPEDARRLAELVQEMPVRVDLIDVNDSSGCFKAPSTAEVATFRAALRAELNMPVSRRYSGGQDIRAACGMLAGNAIHQDRRPQ